MGCYLDNLTHLNPSISTFSAPMIPDDDKTEWGSRWFAHAKKKSRFYRDTILLSGANQLKQNVWTVLEPPRKDRYPDNK